MRLSKISFAWPFVGGFVLGAIGLLVLQPAQATRNLASHLPHLHHAAR